MRRQENLSPYEALGAVANPLNISALAHRRTPGRLTSSFQGVAWQSCWHEYSFVRSDSLTGWWLDRENLLNQVGSCLDRHSFSGVLWGWWWRQLEQLETSKHPFCHHG